LEKSDYDGHEKFESQKEMLEKYKEYYSDKVTLDTVAKMIKFELKK
jgi:arginine repressor